MYDEKKSRPFHGLASARTKVKDLLEIKYSVNGGEEVYERTVENGEDGGDEVTKFTKVWPVFKYRL